MMEATGRNDFVAFGDNALVVSTVIACYRRWRGQPRRIVAELEGCPADTQCRSIFAYLVRHVRYVVDRPGYQFVKSPARLLADGTGDCKSFTLFIASCLHCLGIRHTIRFVNFDGGRQYTHVYPVAYDEEGREIVLDAVETGADGQPIYNYARPYAACREFNFD